MLKLDSIRYMGIKSNLLGYIIPAIQQITPKNGTVCDLMAGSSVVAYALKEYYTVYTNDVQKYSYVISKAVIENQHENISDQLAQLELCPHITDNSINHYYTYFEDVYSQTYFSKHQCQDIDNIRYAIEKTKNIYRKMLYLLALMCAMCKVQSTPGHFAQYMPDTNPRIIPLQRMDLLNEFLNKCNNYSNIYFSNKSNRCYCQDFKELLKTSTLGNVDTIYLDSPYTQEQYSRFYHILETVVKYDKPETNFKAKYRNDRFMSGFCYKSTVASEFETVFSFCKRHSIAIVISYSIRAVLPIDELLSLCHQYFTSVDYTEISHKHSTQGKGPQKIKEILIVCR